MKAGTLTALPTQVPGAEVDDDAAAARDRGRVPGPEVDRLGAGAETGKVVPAPADRADPRRRRLEPRLRRHRSTASSTSSPTTRRRRRRRSSSTSRRRCSYDDNENEEGFLGLAFHPKYKENGEFFVFYTPKKAKLTNVVSRFQVSKDDPDQADPASEEELLRVQAGRSGTTTAARSASARTAISTSPIGDGGSANDPHENGQNLEHAARQDPPHRRRPQGRRQELRDPEGQPVRRPEGRPAGDLGLRPAQPLADGVRPQDRQALGGDVGQNLYEEIDLIDEGRQLRLEPARGAAPVRRRRASGRSRT